MKPSPLIRITFLAMLIVVIAIPTIAQRVDVESYAVSESGSGSVADRGFTVSRDGVSIEFAATKDEGFLTYEYRGLEKLEVGDAVKIHSHMFVPASPLNEERELEPGDDQWAMVTVKSIEKKGNTMKIGLEEPVRIYNTSVRSHGRSGKSPAPSARFAESLRFVGQSDGSWKLVTSRRKGDRKRDKE